MSERVRVLGHPDNPTTIVEDPRTVDNPLLAFFLAYWRRMRGDAALPLRTTFVPSHIGKNLPWVVVADAIAETQDFRYRIIGSHVARYFLADGKGRTLREVFLGENQILGEGAIWVYKRACERRIPIRASGPHNTFRGIVFPFFDALYLPYSSDGRKADRIVNVFWFDEQRFL